MARRSWTPGSSSARSSPSQQLSRTGLYTCSVGVVTTTVLHCDKTSVTATLCRSIFVLSRAGHFRLKFRSLIIYNYRIIGLKKLLDLQYRTLYSALPISDKLFDPEQIIGPKTISGLDYWVLSKLSDTKRLSDQQKLIFHIFSQLS